jgi:hypothetical protein
MLLFANNASSTLRIPALVGDTQLYLATGTGARFPTISGSDTFFVTLVDSLGNVEIVEVTARSTDVLTVTRGQDGTAAKSFPNGSTVDHRTNAETLRRMSFASQVGIPGGFAPLDGSSLVPLAYLPAGVITQTSGDGRYVRLSSAGNPSGYPALDGAAKVQFTNLPSSLLTTTAADAVYIPKTQIGAVTVGSVKGVAPLDTAGKLPAANFDASIIDLTAYATKAAPTFSGTATFGGTIQANNVNVTGNLVGDDISATTVEITETLLIQGGALRGKLTLSTSPPSGTPGEGDEWIQHAA